jgi:hypothetical protein
MDIKYFNVTMNTAPFSSDTERDIGNYINKDIAMKVGHFLNEVNDRTLSSDNRKVFHDLNPKPPAHWYYTEFLKFHEDQQKIIDDYGYNYGHFNIFNNLSVSDEKLRKTLTTYNKNSICSSTIIEYDNVPLLLLLTPNILSAKPELFHTFLTALDTVSILLSPDVEALIVSISVGVVKYPIYSGKDISNCSVVTSIISLLIAKSSSPLGLFLIGIFNPINV